MVRLGLCKIQKVKNAPIIDFVKFQKVKNGQIKSV